MSMSKPEGRVIRVTTPLDYFQAPELVEWKLRVGKKEANRIGKETAKIGTRVDELIKSHKMPKGKGERVGVEAAYSAYYRWVTNYTPIEIVPQKRVEKGIYGVVLSGEPDIMAKGILIDIKGTNRIYPKFWLQLAAYAWLLGWDGPIGILRLDRNTESYQFVVKSFEERVQEELWAIYCGILRSYIYFTQEDEDGND